MRLRHISLALFIALSVSVLCASAQDSRKVVFKTAPVYPDIARRMQLTGTVKLQVVIAADGKVNDVKVTGGHPILVNAAVDAIKKWKYEPAPSETVASVQFDFKF